MTCKDCGRPIASTGKTGLCLPCVQRRPETRAKIAAAQKGKPKSAEHRAKIAAGMRRCWKKRKQQKEAA
ncbi:MAG: hypothetical protein ACRDMH_02845 [Solirubrobacterales bacterium]